MIKNYIKMAWKVLKRRKFFTFISLFGISITLMILVLATSLLENNFGKNQPVTLRDQMVFVPQIALKRINQDTVWAKDSTRLDGKWVYDSTFAITENTTWTSQSSASYHVFDQYLSNLRSAENTSLFCPDATFDVFYENRKIILRGNYTDANYWQIFDFEFLEGGPYQETQVKNQEQVVVISEDTRDEYFGRGQSAMGKEIIVEEKHYAVVGVVKNVSRFKYFVSSDLYMPYTLFEGTDFASTEILGPFKMVFLAKNPGQRNEIVSEIHSLENRVVLPNTDYNVLEFSALTYMEHASRAIFWREDQSKGLRLLILTISGIVLLFILIPTLNLINLNVSRIMERSSEIGVRKAFGANRYHLIYQFIFENIILTLLGGAIGLVLAIGAIKLLNDTKVIPFPELIFNSRVFIYALVVTVAFGIISGLLPAIKMSKMKIVDAIKNIKA